MLLLLLIPSQRSWQVNFTVQTSTSCTQKRCKGPSPPTASQSTGTKPWTSVSTTLPRFTTSWVNSSITMGSRWTSINKSTRLSESLSRQQRSTSGRESLRSCFTSPPCTHSKMEFYQSWHKPSQHGKITPQQQSTCPRLQLLKPIS